MPHPSSSATAKRPRVVREVRPILGWPTDTVSIDYYRGTELQHFPHTLLLFVPGNPGLVHWYTTFLEGLVTELGVGYAARGLSYAGHGLTPDVVAVERWESKHEGTKTDPKNETRDTSIPWTLDGQIQHKVAWVDCILQDLKDLADRWAPGVRRQPRPRFIFLSHSIGAFMVQRLCMLRQYDILRNTCLMIHLMPFTRMDAPQPQRSVLKFAAHNQHLMVGVTRSMFRLARIIPESWLNTYLQRSVKDDNGRKVAMDLVRQPTFARNFFELGCEELRDVPSVPDVDGLRVLGQYCDVAMLYCGADQWGPYKHVEDLDELKSRGMIPDNISVTYMDKLRHGFIVIPEMVPPVKRFCLEAIQRVMYKESVSMSRL